MRMFLKLIVRVNSVYLYVARISKKGMSEKTIYESRGIHVANEITDRYVLQEL
jgi:hypothetical protein